jgi:hypothetical protein
MRRRIKRRRRIRRRIKRRRSTTMYPHTISGATLYSSKQYIEKSKDFLIYI